MKTFDAESVKRITTAATDAQTLMIRCLEELIRELVKFAAHDGACDKQKATIENHLLLDRRRECTCGLQKLYDRIDSLIED